jgi:hypothetical protein
MSILQNGVVLVTGVGAGIGRLTIWSSFIARRI